MKQWEERLRAVAERAFPKGARIIAPPGQGAYVLLVSWKLGPDPARSRLRSKTVRVTISEEAIDDYGRGREGERYIADLRLSSLLGTRLAVFDPTHVTPPGTEPPIVTWLVDSPGLNG